MVMGVYRLGHGCVQTSVSVYVSWQQQREVRKAAALTVSTAADEAGRGTVEKAQEVGHSQADVRVCGPHVQSGEAGKADLQHVLRGHLHVGHLWAEGTRH